MSAHAELPVKFGRYCVLKKLGQGGMGAVYLVKDTRLGRRVALKVPHFTPEDGSTVIERFYREARIAAAIEHPNICPVYDIGEVDGVHYLTMPFIDGMPLSRKVDPNRLLSPREAATLVRRLALAVSVMHEQGVIHRDLKPGNVLLRPNGDPVVMDFGLARSFNGTSRLTATGAAVGTPAYMSPEQIQGQQAELGPATDIYSLGVILFELVTGELPFVGPLHAVYGQILHGTPPAPSQLRPGLDPQLDPICLKAMAKKCSERYTSMAEFAAALAKYVGEAEAVLPPTRSMAATGFESPGGVPPHTDDRGEQPTGVVRPTAGRPPVRRQKRPFPTGGTLVAAFLGMSTGGILGLLIGALLRDPGIGVVVGAQVGVLLGPVAWGAVCGYREAEREKSRAGQATTRRRN